MKRLIQTLLLGLFFGIIGMYVGPLPGQMVETVNGVSFQNPQTGHFNGDLPFSIQDIEKVEIIRGGSSTRYGAGAFAGVVNIILKRDSGFRFKAVTGDNRFFAAGLEAGKRLSSRDRPLQFQNNIRYKGKRSFSRCDPLGPPGKI